MKQNKSVVPHFVAEYIEKYIRLDFPLLEWFSFDYVLDECERKTEQWLYSGSYEENKKREYLLVKAIRFGYEVEKQYHVKILGQYLCVGKNYKGYIAFQDFDDINSEEQYTFTEEEINAIDNRFWVFAEEVYKII